MKAFFSEKGNLMTKYIVNQIAMSVFGVMIATTSMALGDAWLLPFGLFALLFYYFILIAFIREDGLKDALKIDGGRMKKDSFLGLKYCAVAAIPGLVLAILNTVFQSFGAQTGVIASITGVFNVITRIFVYGMYTGIDSYLFNQEIGVFSALNSASSLGITYIVYTFVTLVVSHLAYISGVYQWLIKEKKK